MRPWQTDYDFSVGAHRHKLTRGFGHALMASVLGDAFRVLGVSAAIWNHGTDWFSLHSEPSVGEFELVYGMESERGDYNGVCLSRAWRSREIVTGQHAGYSDLFAPIVARDKTAGILAVGPFARARPTAEQVHAGWHWLTQRRADIADPEFARYLEATLGLLVLEGPRAARFERMVGCIAQLLAGAGRADALATEASVICGELVAVRLPERMWTAVRSMVDDRQARSWESTYRTHELRTLGLSRLAEHVLVGLASSRIENPVEDALVRNAFQRAMVDHARNEGDMIVGQVGARGVVFLRAGSGSAQRSQRRLQDLASRVADLGHKHFGLELCFGVSAALGSVPLSRSYRAALAAAESALVQGARLVTASEREERATISLWQLRQQLSTVMEEKAELLPARFERYLAAVERHAGDRIPQTRAELEIGFERVAEALIAAGALDERSLDDIRATLARDADTARNTSELHAEFRRVVAELAEGLARPVAARQARSLRRAISYMRRHYNEPLRLESVARLAGFTPSYFSKLLARRERSSFVRYVLGLRIERAKHLLRTTDLDAARVAQICGFRTPQYFHAAFRRHAGETPGEWRQGRRSRSAKNRNQKLVKV